MSDKVVGKIFVTSWKNYKKFRDNENNRNLDERHVAKLVASFRKNGWDIEPITVNKDCVIISGHHRLAAAVQAGVDIKYTIADVDYTSTQLQDISSTQKKWTERDVIANFAMLEFMHPSIPGAKFIPTSTDACDVAGFGVNQLYVD